MRNPHQIIRTTTCPHGPNKSPSKNHLSIICFSLRSLSQTLIIYKTIRVPSYIIVPLTMKLLVCLSVLVAAALGAPGLGGRLVGGQDAQPGQFPFQVSLRYCISGNCQHACGGVIISPSWVVTAAHCITEAPGLGSYQVLAGVTNLNDNTANRQLISISHAFINPNFLGGTNPHDLAAVKLSTPLIFGTTVGNVTLPRQGQEFEGGAVTLGWGSIGGSETPIMPNNLQYASTPLVQIAQCRGALDTLLNNSPHPLDDQANVCTGPLTGGIATCTGDSGGALVQTTSPTYTLVGVASWGLTPCGIVGAPSIHVRVSNYINWLHANVDEPL